MVETKYKIGIIKFVAKTGGIKFEDEEIWYNPTTAAKAYVTEDLKGKSVTLTLSNSEKKNQFSFVKLNEQQPTATEERVDSTPTPSEVLSRDDFWKRKEERDILIQKQISKHAVLNTAVEMIKSTGEAATIEKVETLATELLKWIKG